MIIVADSSALIALAACEQLTLLNTLYQTVLVPQAVFDECTMPQKTFAEILHGYLIDKVMQVQENAAMLIEGDLGAGERQAMQLYLFLSANRLLIDDLKAKKIAEQRGIQTTGSLGILIAAYKRGIILEIKPLIHKMLEADIFLSPALIQQVLKLTDNGALS